MRATRSSAQDCKYEFFISRLAEKILNGFSSGFASTTHVPAEIGPCHVGTFPTLRTTCGDYAAGQEVSGAGASFAAAAISVPQSADHTLLPILLESGLSIFPGDASIARRSWCTSDAGVQIQRCAWSV